MRNTFFRRPSPAMIVACLALLVALGGTLGRGRAGTRPEHGRDRSAA